MENSKLSVDYILLIFDIRWIVHYVFLGIHVLQTIQVVLH